MNRLRTIPLPDAFKRAHVGAAFCALGLSVFVLTVLDRPALVAAASGLVAVAGFAVALWRNRT